MGLREAIENLMANFASEMDRCDIIKRNPIHGDHIITEAIHRQSVLRIVNQRLRDILDMN